MNSYFQFRQFLVRQEKCAMKVSTDSCLFGAWVALHLATGARRILDIGAGTGLLSLMVAQSSEAHIDAVEIEAGCFEQLRENIGLSPWAARIHPVHADARDLEARGYDLIISNPPFYEKQLASPDHRTNAARHSSMMDLQALLHIIDVQMNADGHAAVLLPYFRKGTLLATAAEKGLFPLRIADAGHSPSHPMYRTMVIFSRRQDMTQEETIHVRDDEGRYSGVFAELLRPYYLKC